MVQCDLSCGFLYLVSPHRCQKNLQQYIAKTNCMNGTIVNRARKCVSQEKSEDAPNWRGLVPSWLWCHLYDQLNTLHLIQYDACWRSASWIMFTYCKSCLVFWFTGHLQSSTGDIYKRVSGVFLQRKRRGGRKTAGEKIYVHLSATKCLKMNLSTKKRA